MKRRTKITIILIVIAILIILIASPFILFYGFLYFSVKDVRERQVLLLYKTDHKVLLEACRKVLDESHNGIWEKGKLYNVRRDPDPNVLKLPKAILDLKPSYVFIDEQGRLIVEMLGGMDHFGVIAYPKELKGPLGGWEHDKKLIEGLWYYDDGYRESADYEKMIESLKPKDK